VLAQLLLHARLVAEQVGRLRIRTGDPERLADLAELDLQRLEDADDAIDLAVSTLEDLGGLAELGGIEAVLDADEVGEQPAVVALGGLLDDAEQLDVGKARGGSRETHRRFEWERRREDDVAHGARCNMRARR